MNHEAIMYFALPSANTPLVKVIDILCLVFAGTFLGLGVLCLQ